MNVEFPSRRVRLFLSMDFVGSTPYKQANHPHQTISETDGIDPQPWSSPFAHVFSQLELDLDSIWEAVFNVAQGLNNNPNYETSQADLVKLLTHERPFYARETRKNQAPIRAKPHHWKAIGDESVFILKLENPIQALVAVKVFSEAVKKIRAHMRDKKWNPLNVKASAWLAGFPVNNSEIVLGPRNIELPAPKDAQAMKYVAPLAYRYGREHLKERAGIDTKAADLPFPSGKIGTIEDCAQDALHQYLDYVGPQVDVGFRLADLATPEKMTVSADLAYLLARTLYMIKDGGKAIRHEAAGTKDVNDDKRLSAFLKAPVSVKVYRKDPIEFSLNDIKMYYDGRRPLKGVRNGIPYPVFWIANDPVDEVLECERELLGKEPLNKHTSILEKTINLCWAFLHSGHRDPSSSADQWLMPPFIETWNLWSPFSELSKDSEPDTERRGDLKEPGFPKWHSERYEQILQLTARNIDRALSVPGETQRAGGKPKPPAERGRSPD